ncbi:MAG: glycerol kinase GlpK [Acidobacteria bacterium]|nr:glycerol kinase GlpK [Acidobacteriota bacterium]
MPLVLALDQGTTSSRAMLFDHSGHARGIAQREFAQHFPQPGWVEHDADELWATQIGVVNELLARERVAPADIAAVGVTNQRETTVVWNRRTGRPIYHAIVWQDRRTAAACDHLRDSGHGPMVRDRTGLIIDAYFSATKLAWILDNVEGAHDDADAGALAFGTVDTWLVWNLTGGTCHVTEPSNASRTMLFNIHAGDWDADLLDLLRIPRSLLPEVRSSSEVYGAVTSPDTSLRAPIAGIAGDQQAALFGQLCLEPGLAKNTYGTGCFLLLNTGSTPGVSEHQLLTTVGWQVDGRTEYALEGSIFTGGAAVQWLRDGLGIVESAGEVESLARSVDDTAGVYVVPAFTGLGAPHWDPYARGTIVGLTRGTTSGHIARAALEGIAHQVGDVVDAMKQDTGLDIIELRVDGGAASNDLLMQFQSDILGVPIVRPRVTETTALGAAYLAGLAVGFWKGRDDIGANWHIEKRFEPGMLPSEVEHRRSRWASALDRARRWETP